MREGTRGETQKLAIVQNPFRASHVGIYFFHLDHRRSFQARPKHSREGFAAFGMNPADRVLPSTLRKNAKRKKKVY